MFDSNGERGRNRTYNLLIKRQCTGVWWGLVRNVFNTLRGAGLPLKPWFPMKTGRPTGRPDRHRGCIFGHGRIPCGDEQDVAVIEPDESVIKPDVAVVKIEWAVVGEE